jgi:hypothetical protein
MDVIIKRFEAGVHERNECGMNRNGYAAIDSIFECADVHKLNSCIMQSSSRPLMHCKKKQFSSSEGLVYIFMKLKRVIPRACTYILLLSRDMPISSTLKSVIDASALASNVIVTVIEFNGVFSIEIYFANIHMIHTVDSPKSLKSFLVNSGLSNRIVVVGYPSLPESHMDIVNQLNTMLWCAPATRHLTYSSFDTNHKTDHFVYPWSKSPLCLGFTLGKGKIKYSSLSERDIYVGLYNTYEMMISSVPYRSSCTDCTDLQLVASTIKSLVDPTDKSLQDRHLKRSSVHALEELKAKLKEYSSRS